MGIDRGALHFVAGATGHVDPVVFSFPASMLETHDGGRADGVVLLALQTTPGQPAPSGAFDCKLIGRDDVDLLAGAGRACDGTRRTDRMIRTGAGHPFIPAGERLQFRIAGNTTPGARIEVRLTYAAARLNEDEETTDGRVN